MLSQGHARRAHGQISTLGAIKGKTWSFLRAFHISNASSCPTFWDTSRYTMVFPSPARMCLSFSSWQIRTGKHGGEIVSAGESRVQTTTHLWAPCIQPPSLHFSCRLKVASPTGLCLHEVGSDRIFAQNPLWAILTIVGRSVQTANKIAKGCGFSNND